MRQFTEFARFSKHGCCCWVSLMPHKSTTNYCDCNQFFRFLRAEHVVLNVRLNIVHQFVLERSWLLKLSKWGEIVAYYEKSGELTVVLGSNGIMFDCWLSILLRPTQNWSSGLLSKMIMGAARKRPALVLGLWLQHKATIKPSFGLLIKIIVDPIKSLKLTGAPHNVYNA